MFRDEIKIISQLTHEALMRFQRVSHANAFVAAIGECGIKNGGSVYCYYV
jgi:hypothetical protein